MSLNAIEIIRSEHRSVAAVLDGLRFFNRAVAREGANTPLDFLAIRTLLYYLDVFPEQYHHPKEDLYLFSAVHGATSEGDPVIAKLRADHAQGEARVMRVMRAAIRAECEPQRYLQAYLDDAEAFVADYLRHMNQEEEILLPLAKRSLDAEEWKRVDEAFLANEDPLAGAQLPGGSSRDYHALLSRVVNIVPAPIGLGSGTP